MLLDGLHVPAWQRRMIEVIQQSDYSELVLVVANGYRAGREGAWQDANAVVADHGIVRRLLLSLQDYLVNKVAFLPDASSLVDIEDLLAGITVVRSQAISHGGFDSLDGDVVTSCLESRLDVLVQLGFRLLDGDILKCARHGVWTYHYNDARSNPEARAGFWEAMESAPVVGTTLRRLGTTPGESVLLYRSFACTNDMSLRDNMSNAYWTALHFVPRKLKELHRDGEVRFLDRLNQSSAGIQFQDNALYAVPGDFDLASLLVRKLWQRLRRKWAAMRTFDQWFLLYDIQTGESTSLRRFKKLLPPRDSFWADPFIVVRDDTYFVFFEELSYATQKGHISVIEISKTGVAGSPRKVLDRPYHLSYPFVFEFQGELYMIPESMANRTVEIYKCTAFPDGWEFQKNLMANLEAVDSTLFFWRGKWWMFTSQSELPGGSPWDELYLYYSDSPLSEDWVAHPQNPVVSDARSARPAGKVFERNGRLYRPSQNCSFHYGYGFNMCEITALTETVYEERIVSSVEPDWEPDLVSAHTFNYEDGLTVVDAQALCPR